MVPQTRQSRLDDLVAAFTELGANWYRWTIACTPATSISYVRMRLLRVLEQHGDQTMTALARGLTVTQRRVTALVDALAEDGYIERRPNPADGRSTVISLTDRGAKHLEVTWHQFRNDIGSVFGDLPVEQQEQLLEITPVLTDALRERLSTRPSVECPP